MRKFIALLTLLLAAYRAGATSPSIVQSSPNTCFAQNVATIACAFSSSVVAGHMIVVWVLTDAGTINTPTMTGETFVNLANASNTGTSGNQFKCFTVNSANGGQTSVTATTTSSGNIHVHMQEVSGQAGSPIDASGNHAPSTTVSVSTSGSTTTSTDLVIAFFGDENNNRTLTVESSPLSYTLSQLTNDSGGGDSALSEWVKVSTTGTQTATAGGNSGDAIVMGIIAIAGTGGGATATRGKRIVI